MQQITTFLTSVKIRWLVLGVTLGLLGGTYIIQIANAAIPDTTGTINSCYTGGLLPTFRIIDGTTCNAGETRLWWKQGGSATGVLRTDLNGKDLTGAQMVYWDLRNMNFTGTIFSSGNLSGADFKGSTLTNANLSGTNLSDTDFTNVSLTGVNLSNAQLNRTLLSGTTFGGANLSYTNFFNQNLSGKNLSTVTSFEGLTIASGNLSSVTLPSSPNFRSAGLNDTDLSGNNFSNGNFAGANLIGSTFGSSNVTNVTWVQGPLSAICPDATFASSHSNTCAGHLVP
jgi:uncharacterized protein YjbI with pentapeptide repeats